MSVLGLRENGLIVLCAGAGKRMGKPIPKMLLPLFGKPLLYWTLKNLEKCPTIGAIVLVAPPKYERVFERLVRDWRIKKVAYVVAGGKERADSTRAALPNLPKECKWIGIHDGARPFVSSDLVKDCFNGARSTGAAILATPAKETLKLVGSGRHSGLKPENPVSLTIKKTIPRSSVWAAQTPQVFRRDILERMFTSKKNSSIKKSAPFTDDSMLAESIGVSVRIVPSTDTNIKITTPLDMILAEAVLKKKR